MPTDVMEVMPYEAAPAATLPALDEPTRLLVRAAGAVTAGSERAVRAALAEAAAGADPLLVEELLLQTYLFAGFPRALNAMREWRKVSGRPAPDEDPATRFEDADAWRTDGERTCATVYGRLYDGLRTNVKALHPALDAWMVVEGYGKVLSRRGMELRVRELCIVAACAAAQQDRQLHSHLIGALNCGAEAWQVTATLDAVRDMNPPDVARRFDLLWRRVQGK